MENNWKDKNIPQQQLSLNLQQLSSKNKYPPHWKDFLNLMKTIKVDSLYDLGCGIGSLYKVILDNEVSVNYIGIDFSEAAIQLASKTWNYSEFYTDDFRNLKYDFSNSIIYASGLLDILPNGIEELKNILNYKSKYVLLSRIELGLIEQISRYNAYNIEITKYIFNKNDFLNTLKQYGYRILNQSNNSYLLTQIPFEEQYA
jgi:putative methyltransferase (TIGR04325 family)